MRWLLDLTKYKNLEKIYFETYELATPLTEIDITGCQKVRRIYLSSVVNCGNHKIFVGEKAIDTIKIHPGKEELEKIISETEQNIEGRKVIGGTRSMGD